MAVELKVPEAGESVQEVQVGDWRKEDGEYVDQDEVLVEIETDKAAMELPAPSGGTLSIRKHKGEIAKVGDVLATIDETAARPEGKPEAQAERQQAEPHPSARSRLSEPDRAAAKPEGAEPPVMPAARRALAESGLKPGQVEPSGPGGRLLKEDVQRQAEQAHRIPARREVPPEKPAARPTAAGPAAIAPPGPRQEETVPMSMLRRRVARRLVEAQQTAAMLTTFNEADLSAVIQLRREENEPFEKRYGIRLGFMSFFVKASIDALKLYPQINAEVRGDDIIYRNYYDIGVAVSTDRGLVVPVLRSAELLSFAQIEQTIAELAGRARDNKLTLEELEGGTFTITNGGVFGSLLSTPILNPPQSGILGLHAIQERPVVRDGQIVVRPMMYVALTYDHRIVDGREAVTFLRRVKECVESPARMLLEA